MAESNMGVPEDPAVQDAADVLRAGREQVFEEAKTKVRAAAEAQRQRAAQAVGGMAGALHRIASDVNAENKTMGHYTDMAAERLDEVADYLRDANWGQVIEGAEGFARRQPYWFMGGAVAAGFVLARFVKNSGQAARISQRVAAQRVEASSYGLVGAEAGVYPAGTVSGGGE
ncbi:MAG: hypothetical protein K2X44_02180 [Magnetospirillum sp.]|nr:hypothetical protein [Magnetospirillum sp.]